jgi:hypothetical protein
MTVKRSNHTSNYTKIPNAMPLDGRLSVEAKGALAYMLSRPPGWRFYHWELQQTLRIGRQKLERIINELIAAGYLTRSRVQPRDANNRFLGYEYVVCDVPSMQAQPCHDSPQRSNRGRKPDNNIKKDASRNDLTNSPLSPLSQRAAAPSVGEQYTDLGLARIEQGLTFVYEGSKPFFEWSKFRGDDGLPPFDIVIKDGVKRRGIWMLSLYPPRQTDASED